MAAYDRWRLAGADEFRREGQIVRIAHDPGDPQITSHCPFCGSGQIVGRSDGTIGCDFCGMNYIVRVQPAFRACRRRRAWVARRPMSAPS